MFKETYYIFGKNYHTNGKNYAKRLTCVLLHFTFVSEHKHSITSNFLFVNIKTTNLMFCKNFPKQWGGVFVYNSQELVKNIKSLAKSKKVSTKQMLLDCDLNVNALNQMSDKKGISSFSLAKIADYLDTSVDYLLGRIETPEIDPANKLQADFFKVFQKLPFEEQVNLMNIAMQKAS